MGPYVLRRLVQLPAAVAAIVVVAWVVIHLAPGDPVLVLAGEHGDEGHLASMRARFGLDRPLHEQLAVYAAQVLRLDLGVSYTHGRPVVAVIAERLPATLLLTGTALVASTVLGVGLGALAASRRFRLVDVVVTISTLVVLAAPAFWLAQLALLFLALELRLLPVHGMTAPGASGDVIGAALDVARHLVLPALVLAAAEVAVITRTTRAALLNELSQDYVRTARAYGFSERRILLRHALRRALLPVITVVGARAGHLLGGAAIVEAVFGWPGIGRLSVTAAQTRDAPILLGVVLLLAFTVVVANLLTDLAYGWLDPRIRHR